MSLVKKKERFISETKPKSFDLHNKVNKINERSRRVLSRMLKDSNMTQVSIEKELNFAKGYFNQVLNGKIELKLDHITLVCELLEFPVTLFFQIVCETESLPEEIEQYDNGLVKRLKGLLVMICSEDPQRMLKVVGYEQPYQADRR